MPVRPVALSILDLSPVAAGSSGAISLRNSLDLARLADRLGFTRYWVAEHHNLPSIASSAPDIMIGQIAAATRRMRVGSGGDRKSTRLNSSHTVISYAVFCLKKKKTRIQL